MTKDYAKEKSSDFFKRVNEVYSTVMGGEHKIVPIKNRLKTRIKKHVASELLSYMDYGQDPAADLKLELAALKFAEFLSKQDNRPYDYMKDSFNAAVALRDFPAMGLSNVAYMKGRFGALMVPNYSTETKEVYKASFEEIFEDIRHKSGAQLEEEVKNMSDRLLEKMPNNGAVFSHEKPLQRVFPKCTEEAKKKSEEYVSTHSPLHKSSGSSPQNPEMRANLTQRDDGRNI